MATKTVVAMLALLALASPAQAWSLDAVIEVIDESLGAATQDIALATDVDRPPVPPTPEPELATMPPAPPDASRPPVVDDATQVVEDVVAPVPAFTCTASRQGMLLHLEDQSTAGAARILVWAWDFGDGTHVEAQTPSANPASHGYLLPGTYTVRLTVLDALGERVAHEQVCRVLPASHQPPKDLRVQVPEAAPRCGIAGAPRHAVVEPATPMTPSRGVDPCTGRLAERPTPTTPAADDLLGGGPALAIPDRPGGASLLHADTEPETTVEFAAVTPASPSLAPLAFAGFSLSLAFTGPGRRILRWLLLAPLGLFTRVKEDELLDHPVRTAIVQVIEAEPGIHYQGLVRQVGKGNGVVEHHLRMLTQGGLVRQRNAGGYTCYFLAATDRRLMDAHSVLKADVARRILDQLVAETGRPVGRIAKDIGVTTKAVSYHLRRFEGAGLVTLERDGRTTLAHAAPLAFMAAGAA